VQAVNTTKSSLVLISVTSFKRKRVLFWLKYFKARKRLNRIESKISYSWHGY